MSIPDPTIIGGNFRIEPGSDTALYGLGDCLIDNDITVENDATFNNTGGVTSVLGNFTASGTTAQFGAGDGTSTSTVNFYSGTAGDLMSYDPTSASLTITGTAATTALNVADGNVTITDDLDVNGLTTLDQVTIDTADGQLLVSGANAVDIDVGASSRFVTSAGNVTIDSEAGNLVMGSGLATTLTSDGGNTTINVLADNDFVANATRHVTLSSGTGATSGDFTINSAFNIDVNATGGVGNSAITIDTNDTTNGIAIGTGTASVPISIGNATSEVTINDNLNVTGNTIMTGDLTVNGTTTTINTAVTTYEDNLLVTNSTPISTGVDGGILVKRFQDENDVGTGELVNDTAKETSADHAADTFVVSSTSTTVVFANDGTTPPSAADDFYNNWYILITGGTGVNQVREITDYVGSTRTATINTAWTTNPTNVGSSTYSLFSYVYAGSFYDETLDEWALAYTVGDPGAGSVTIQDYINLHVNNLTVDGLITIAGFQTETVTISSGSAVPVNIPNTSNIGSYLIVVSALDTQPTAIIAATNSTDGNAGQTNRISSSKATGALNNLNVDGTWTAGGPPQLFHRQTTGLTNITYNIRIIVS